MAIYKLHSYIGSRRWNPDEWRWEYSRADGEIMMKHDKQFLVFTKEWAPSRTYKYNLNTGEFIRVIHKKGEDKEIRVERRNVANWFGKSDLATEDSKFARLYAFAEIQNNRRHNYSNPSWHIDLLAGNSARIMEQWLSMGFVFRELERQMTNGSVYIGYREEYEVLHAPNEYSKKLLDYLKEKYVGTGREITFTELNKYYDHWNNNQYKVFKEIEKKIEEEPQYVPVFNCPTSKYSSYDRDILHDNGEAAELRNQIIITMQTYNLELNAFLEYLLYLSHSESINLGKLMSDYPDYLRRELYLKGGKMSKMNKYPECWLTTTYKQQKEYSKLQALDKLEQEGGNQRFNNSIEANKHLEWKKGNYLIRMPTGAQDIRDEADQMQHCVATYIPDIEAGKRIVMFMRDAEHPERSLVTVEVINGAITQAYAKNDDHPSMACKIWLMQWAREKDLRMTAVTLQ